MALIDNIVAYWKLDEISGNAVDSTGNGYALTNTNSVIYSPGKINNGADFGSANTDKMLTIANPLGINNNNCTFSMWVKLNTEITSGEYCFFRQFNTSTWTGFALVYQYNGGSRRLVFRKIRQNVAFYEIPAIGTMGTSNWYHLVLTYTGGGVMTAYVNGSFIDTISNNGNGSSAGLTNQFQLGAFESSAYASAIVDEVGVWNRVLSGAEISELYNSGSGIQYPFIPYVPSSGIMMHHMQISGGLL